MKTSVLSSMMVAASVASVSSASVLWDQSALNMAETAQGLFNSVSPGFNGGIVYGVSDVTVPAGGWNMQSVTVYYSALSWFEGSVLEGVLNVIPKTGALPGADPRPSPTGVGTQVPVTMTTLVINDNGVNVITASGLNLNLAAGDYWIGLTPIGPTGPFGPDYQWSTTAPSGVNQAARAFGPDSGWFDYGALAGAAVIDGAIKIEGALVPAPSSIALLGLAGFAARRRR